METAKETTNKPKGLSKIQGASKGVMSSWSAEDWRKDER